MVEHAGIIFYNRNVFMQHIANLDIPKNIIDKIDNARANRQSIKIPLKAQIRGKQVDIDLEYDADKDIYIVRYHNIDG